MFFFFLYSFWLVSKSLSHNFSFFFTVFRSRFICYSRFFLSLFFLLHPHSLCMKGFEVGGLSCRSVERVQRTPFVVLMLWALLTEGQQSLQWVNPALPHVPGSLLEGGAHMYKQTRWGRGLAQGQAESPDY